MFTEDELLPLSGLQHLAYCERQWALIHLEQAWAENRFTAEGRQLHEKADSGKQESRPDLRIARGLQLQSLRLGLIGRADVVEFHRMASEPQAQATGPQTFEAESAAGNLVQLRGARGLWRPYPVEYKRGQKKRGNFDRVQLCAQALCLEEMLGVSIGEGALFYGKTRRREVVALDAGLRDETMRLAERMHALYREYRTPVVAYDPKRCDRCSLFSLCLPKTTGSSPSVESYIRLALG